MMVRRATAEDVDDILYLTNYMADRGLMLPRSKYNIVARLTGFYVVVDTDPSEASRLGTKPEPGTTPGPEATPGPETTLGPEATPGLETTPQLTIAGCGAFVPLWTDMGEIMSLAVRDEYQGKGVGKMLVDVLIEEGRRLKMTEVITLTYQVDFFGKMGFTVVDKDRFPRKMWRECLECPKLEQCDETAMHMLL
jgi:N-acetylglutamate synthase-like GNAT family acetyltransferase